MLQNWRMKEFYKPTGRNGDSKESDASHGDGTDSSGVVIPPQCQGCPYANYIKDSSTEGTKDETPGIGALGFARNALERSGCTNEFPERLDSTANEVLEELNSILDEEVDKNNNNKASDVLKAQSKIDKATKGCTGPLTTKIPAPVPDIDAGPIAELTLTMCDSPTLYGDKPVCDDTHDPEKARKQYISGLRGALQSVDDGEEDYSVTSRRLIKEIRDADDNKSQKYQRAVGLYSIIYLQNLVECDRINNLWKEIVVLQVGIIVTLKI